MCLIILGKLTEDECYKWIKYKETQNSVVGDETSSIFVMMPKQHASIYYRIKITLNVYRRRNGE